MRARPRGGQGGRHAGGPDHPPKRMTERVSARPVSGLVSVRSPASVSRFGRACARAGPVTVRFFLGGAPGRLRGALKWESGATPERGVSPTRLRDLVRRAIEPVVRRAGANDVAIELVEGEDAVAMLDEPQIARVLDNLLDNAVRFSRRRGRV